jgi:hypothetical protein
VDDYEQWPPLPMTFLSALTPNRTALLGHLRRLVTDEDIRYLAEADGGLRADQVVPTLSIARDTGRLEEQQHLVVDPDLLVSRWLNAETADSRRRRLFASGVLLDGLRFDYARDLGVGPAGLLPAMIEDCQVMGREFSLSLRESLADYAATPFTVVEDEAMFVAVGLLVLVALDQDWNCDAVVLELIVWIREERRRLVETRLWSMGVPGGFAVVKWKLHFDEWKLIARQHLEHIAAQVSVDTKTKIAELGRDMETWLDRG